MARSSLRADRIALNTVLGIPNRRIDPELLLRPEDGPRLVPYVRQVLAEDRDLGLLYLCFLWPSWNHGLAVLRVELGIEAPDFFPTAPSFAEEVNGRCFFAWYSATVRGNGDLYPCCLLMAPGYEPLGNVRSGSFAEDWHPAAIGRLRDEMSLVLRTGGRLPAYRVARLKHLRSQCVEPYRCALKSMHFRHDEKFYRRLAQVAEQLRLDEAGRRRSLGERPKGRPDQVAWGLRRLGRLERRLALGLERRLLAKR